MWAWLGDNGHPQWYEQATSDLLEAFYLQDGDAARARIDIGGVTYVVSREAHGWMQRRVDQPHRARPVLRLPAGLGPAILASAAGRAPGGVGRGAHGGGGGGGRGGRGGGGAASGASTMFVETFECRDSSALDLAAVLRWRVLRPGEWDEGATDPILMCDLGEDGESVVRLPCHSDAISCTFNRSTVEQAFASSPKCPTCGQPYPLPGPQPSGVMRCRASGAYDCDGHPGCGVIEAPPGSNQVLYEFPSGMQGPQHPRPGTAYSGTRRAAILPNDATGREALALLRAAFTQGKAFAVGDSATTGRSDVVVWRIHQKTQPMGGETRHGWPDATYLDRLRSECATAAVVPP